MTLPPSIKVNVSAPFPTLVVGSGPIALTKLNGIWTIGFSLTILTYKVPNPATYATDLMIYYDQGAKQYFTFSVADLAAALISVPPAFDTAAGDYNVTNESTLLIDKLVPAAHNINLPAAATRNGAPLVIKDIAGNAAAHIATIVPNGADTIDGLANLPLNANYGGFRLVPLAAGNWYVSP